MKREKYYFKYSDSEMCYNKKYFDNYMQENGLTEIEVFEAMPEIIGGGIFWCKKHSFCGNGTTGTCGKRNCNDYEPRNKVSGVCIHHTCWLYTHGNKIILRV